MARFDVVALGDLNCDLILTGLGGPPAPGREVLAGAHRIALGGSTGIFAGVLGSLGDSVGFVGLVGQDHFGDLVCQFLERHRVDPGGVLKRQDVRTGLTISLVRAGDRALVTVPGSVARLRAEHVPWDYVRQGRHLHVASYYLQAGLRPALGGILAKARRSGLTTSLDTGWDPGEEWDWPGLAALLPVVDVFLPNETEALHLTGAGDVEGALAALLAAGAGIVAIKRGAAGAIAGRGAERARAAAHPVQAIDPTGAGDSFDAGFIHCYLRGGDLASCLAFANACGALATLRIGGAEGAPSAAEVISFLGPVEGRNGVSG